MNTVTTNKLAAYVVTQIDNNVIRKIGDNLLAAACDPNNPRCIDAITAIVSLVERTEHETLDRKIWDFLDESGIRLK